MKLILEQIPDHREEVIIRYHQMTEEIEAVINYVEGQNRLMVMSMEGEQVVLQPGNVIYFESVDGFTYAYTKDEVYRCPGSLADVAACHPGEGYFRCSKSMVVNIYHIASLKSLPGNRIDALMDNGEHVVISRRYAGNLRNLLKGGGE